eukprot:6537585-Prymnesium_polylepis.1
MSRTMIHLSKHGRFGHQPWTSNDEFMHHGRQRAAHTRAKYKVFSPFALAVFGARGLRGASAPRDMDPPACAQHVCPWWNAISPATRPSASPAAMRAGGRYHAHATRVRCQSQFWRP